jgi:dienelactone hydrolase
MNATSILCILAAAAFSAMLAGPAAGAIKTEIVEYKDGETVLEGYLAYDDARQDKRPGVMVVHEWYGLNEYARMRTRQLAELGYVAFAADIYGKGRRATTAEEAGKLAGEFRGNPELLRRRAQLALDTLKANPRVDATKVAAIGYCFGGTTVLELARGGADLQAVVSFHGGLATMMPAKEGQVKAEVLVLHGADDPMAPAAEVEAFQKEMRQARANWQMNIYSGAVHSFTNPDSGNDPSRGVAYNKQADQRSWAAMKLFFAETIGAAEDKAETGKDLAPRR